MLSYRYNSSRFVADSTFLIYNMDTLDTRDRRPRRRPQTRSDGPLVRLYDQRWKQKAENRSEGPQQIGAVLWRMNGSLGDRVNMGAGGFYMRTYLGSQSISVNGQLL